MHPAMMAEVISGARAVGRCQIQVDYRHIDEHRLRFNYWRGDIASSSGAT